MINIRKCKVLTRQVTTIFGIISCMYYNINMYSNNHLQLNIITTNIPVLFTLKSIQDSLEPMLSKVILSSGGNHIFEGDDQLL